MVSMIGNADNWYKKPYLNANNTISLHLRALL